MCHPVWLCSRKYGTVWCHPASSKLWYLTALSFVNFQEKLTGTSCDSLHVWSQLVRLAVCLALGAHFASTHFLARLVGRQPKNQDASHWGHYGCQHWRPFSWTTAAAPGRRGPIPAEVHAILQEEQEWRPVLKEWDAQGIVARGKRRHQWSGQNTRYPLPVPELPEPEPELPEPEVPDPKFG
jgi:hypothetical protein